jgi:hypothetical protein
MDPNTIITMGALGSLLNIVKNYREAEGLNRKAWPLAKKVFGPWHHRTLVIMDFLGVSLKGLDRLGEAEEILRDALKLRETESGKYHPDTMLCLKHLVSVLSSQGRQGEALKLRNEFCSTEMSANLSTLRTILGANTEVSCFMIPRILERI